MFKPFEAQEARFRLLNLLRRSGYGVRMHAYEYFVRGKRFIAFIHLMPSENLAVIRGFRWNLAEFQSNVGNLKRLLRLIEPNVKIEVLVS